MENKEQILKNLTGKNEEAAQKAAFYLIDNSDSELFSMLASKTDFLFDFVRNNVNKRIEKAVNKKNFKNIIKFFNTYSPYYDDLFSNILATHATQELTDEIFELLQKGTEEQKTYAAKYFSYIPDTVALEDLSKYAFSDDEYLSYNAAQALGQMQDDISFDIALSMLENNDDFDKLKAVKFFTAYGRNFPLKEIFAAVKSSKMPENISGQIPYMVSLIELLNSEYKPDTLITIDYIIIGLGEILPLSDIFQFELFEVFENLICLNSSDNEYSGKISEILLSSLLKFKEFCSNEEYIFDEDKNTKQEINDIYKLLNSQNDEFWNNQKIFVLKEFETSDDRIISAINVVKEYNLTESIPLLKNLISSKNEIVICEAVCALKHFGVDNEIDLKAVTSSIKNPNIKAIIENN